MLTTKQAANQLNVCTAAVRNYIRNGVGKENERLKAIWVMVGRRKEYRIKNDDLEYFRKKYLTNEIDRILEDLSEPFNFNFVDD